MKQGIKYGLLCGVLVGVLISMVTMVNAQESPTGESSGQPVSLLYNTMNRYLPFKTVWDIINSNVPNSVRDFWGARGKMEEKGITFAFVYTGDMAYNMSGGIKKGSTYFGNLDMSIALDTEKLGFWKGGTFYIYAISDFGRKRLSAEKVGDLQGVSNIDAGHTTKLFELWFEQKLFEDKLAVLMGIHDINADFDTNENGGDLLNGSFGIQPTLTANTSASVFPSTGPAIRLKLTPNEQWTILLGVFDGNQGDSEGATRHGLNNSVNDKGGLLSIAEVDYHLKIPMPMSSEVLPGTIRLGAWSHNAKFDDVSDVDDNGDPIRHDGNYGIYLTADQMLYKENSDEKDDQGLGVFVQWSQVPRDRNEVVMYRGFGLRYKGLIPNRNDDAFSLGMGQAFISDALRNSSGQEDYERVVEATYKIQLTPAVILQPDIQFIANPSADPAIKNATVFTLRTQISF